MSWSVEHPGFYLVRFRDGSFTALADRSPRNGLPVRLADLGGGRVFPSHGFTLMFQDIHSRYIADGFVSDGPGSGPLDSLSLSLEGNRLYVAPYATRPAYRAQSPWCDRRPGASHASELCSKLVPGLCWSPTRCDPIYGHIRYPPRWPT
jgi:hypothetical protein